MSRTGITSGVPGGSGGTIGTSGTSKTGGTSGTDGISGTDDTPGTGGQAKLRYLIQARNSLFQSDNMYQPVGTLDTRINMKLRIALIHQRIWLVRQSRDLTCCAKVRRRVRYIIHPRSWRLMRELRSKLDSGPVSSMREEPGTLNQRIQVLASKMIYYDGSINEQDEDNYQQTENEDYVEVTHVSSPTASVGELSPLRKASSNTSSNTSSNFSSSASSNTPVIPEEVLKPPDPAEVVVEIVEAPPGVSAE